MPSHLVPERWDTIVADGTDQPGLRGDYVGGDDQRSRWLEGGEKERRPDAGDGSLDAFRRRHEAERRLHGLQARRPQQPRRVTCTSARSAAPGLLARGIR